MLQQVHTQQIYTYDIQRNEQIQKIEDSELEKYKRIHVLRIYYDVKNGTETIYTRL